MTINIVLYHVNIYVLEKSLLGDQKGWHTYFSAKRPQKKTKGERQYISKICKMNLCFLRRRKETERSGIIPVTRRNKSVDSNIYIYR